MLGGAVVGLSKRGLSLESLGLLLDGEGVGRIGSPTQRTEYVTSLGAGIVFWGSQICAAVCRALLSSFAASERAPERHSSYSPVPARRLDSIRRL